MLYPALYKWLGTQLEILFIDRDYPYLEYLKAWIYVIFKTSSQYAAQLNNIWNLKKIMKNKFIQKTVKQNCYAVVHVYDKNSFSFICWRGNYLYSWTIFLYFFKKF